MPLFRVASSPPYLNATANSNRAYRDPVVATLTAQCDWRIADLVGSCESVALYLAVSPFLEGDGTSGAIGVKGIATYLNERRFFTRHGGRWGLAQIHTILTRTTHSGKHRFNTRSHKDREKKRRARSPSWRCRP
jgi:hypothetical protein